MSTQGATQSPEAPAHNSLMDATYRWQRHIYDATRKYFLFGRDRLIADLNLPQGGTVLELGCGTGRNLAQVARHWPKAQLYGLDISSEMLKTAATKLGPRAHLAAGDATQFDAATLFNRPHVDRVIISFALSMIPQWEAAIIAACATLAPGGSLHIVDFGDCQGLPTPARMTLTRWLTHFHVTPRLALFETARLIAKNHGLTLTTKRGPMGYYQIVQLTRPASFSRPA